MYQLLFESEHFCLFPKEQIKGCALVFLDSLKIKYNKYFPYLAFYFVSILDRVTLINRSSIFLALLLRQYDSAPLSDTLSTPCWHPGSSPLIIQDHLTLILENYANTSKTPSKFETWKMLEIRRYILINILKKRTKIVACSTPLMF